MPGSGYRVHNHSNRVLLLTTRDGTRYRLLAGCASPPDAAPLRIQALENIAIDGSSVWEVEKPFDVHIAESETDPSEPTLHISGLGVRRTDAPFEESSGRTPLWAAEKGDVWVTILGAGITGLTAAHELVTRGFRVQVIEKAHGSPAESDGQTSGTRRFRRGLGSPDVGGIARTQWTTQPLAQGGAPPQSQPRPIERLSAMRSVHGDCHWFGADKTAGQECDGYRVYGVAWTASGVDPATASTLSQWLIEVSSRAGRSVAAVQLVAVIYGDGNDRRVAEGYQRLGAFLDYLDQASAADLRDTLDRLEVFPTARIDVKDPPTGTPFVGLLVRVHEDLGLVAGEHGFRFFPGFYRHLRDTMRRTPIYDPQTRTFTARCAHDNLTEVQWQVFADPARQHPASLLRKPLTSVGGLIEQYREMRRDLGYRPVDLLRFLLRLLRYMTSSIQRRKADYESMSWWDFLTLKRLDDRSQPLKRFTLGERFEAMLRHAPKALVAMGCEFTDARTQGNVAVQLMMDHFDLHDQSDSTLSGPTSPAWLSHWRTYLQHQGVRFFVGEVTEIAPGPRARVTIAFPDGEPPDYLDAEGLAATSQIAAHYYLSAMDIVGLARTTRGFRRPGDTADYGVLSDLKHLVGEPGQERDLEDISHVGRGGEHDGLDDRFQTLTGIQFYYRSHISFQNGHIYFVDSPWGLSAVSQVQYWGPFGAGRRSRVASNLSIDIGSWRPDSRDPTGDPNLLSRDQIADRVQEQVLTSLRSGTRRLGRIADYYHLDDYLGFARKGEALVPARNHAPFLINRTGDWNHRPDGEPWAPNEPAMRDRIPGQGTTSPAGIWRHERAGYPVHLDNLVVAGTHMRTFTRMGTMEAANESARHAVNAILDHLTFKNVPSARGPDEPALGREPIAGTRGRTVQSILSNLATVAVTREPPHPSVGADRMPTPYGDYCDIWNPEMHEFPDLEFLCLIDSHLMNTANVNGDDRPAGQPAVAPHLFDILRIDELPDRLNGDHEALAALEMIGSAFDAFQESSHADLPGLFAIVEKVRQGLTAFPARAPAPGRTSR